MGKHTSDAESLGYRDGQEYVYENTKMGSVIMRRDDWDEALINALGRREILENLCGVDDTEENWQSVGLPFCKIYNDACIRGVRDALNAHNEGDE